MTELPRQTICLLQVDGNEALPSLSSNKLFNSYEYAMTSSDKHTDNYYYRKINFTTGEWIGARLTSFFNPPFMTLLYINKNSSGDYTLYGNNKILDSTQVEILVSADKKTLYIKSSVNVRFYIETTSKLTLEAYKPS